MNKKKLSDKHVLEIMASTQPEPELAKRYGVAERYIYLLRAGLRRKDLTNGHPAVAPPKKRQQQKYLPKPENEAKTLAAGERLCNTCRQPFKSWDRTKNQHCPACKDTPEWRSGGDFAYHGVVVVGKREGAG